MAQNKLMTLEKYFNSEEGKREFNGIKMPIDDALKAKLNT